MSTVARQPEPITREGFERLRAELEHLTTVRRRATAEDLREAREDATDTESVGVSAVLDEQAALERRIDELECALASVRVIEPPADGVAGLGQRVEVRLAPGAPPVAYELVGPLEADTTRRRISIASPVGEALVGRRAGDAVDVVTPLGTKTIEIVAVGATA